MIELDNITRSFGSLQVLKGISLKVDKGEIISITGPSGAGKTTLLQIMGSLDKPDSGHVLYNGQDITRMGEKELSAFRCNHIGFVFQFHQLLPEFTALENVTIPMLIAGQGMRQASARAKKLLDLMKEPPVGELRLEKSPGPAERAGGFQAQFQQHLATCQEETLKK